MFYNDDNGTAPVAAAAAADTFYENVDNFGLSDDRLHRHTNNNNYYTSSTDEMCTIVETTTSNHQFNSVGGGYHYRTDDVCITQPAPIICNVDGSSNAAAAAADTYPELIISPDLYRNVSRSHLDELSLHFKMLTLDSLRRISVGATLIGVGNRFYQNQYFKLVPRFNQRLTIGTNINVTSYFFSEPIDMYRIESHTPRYVLWTLTDPTPICATYLDRTDVYGLFGALRRALDWARSLPPVDSYYRHRRRCNTIVFDLDRTLISDECEILKGACDTLQVARHTYDKVVLWSHGTSLHVDENVSKLTDCMLDMYADKSSETIDCSRVFDLVLSNNGLDTDEHQQSCKNLLHLYNYYPELRFERAVLVDDSLYNWTPEYTDMFVPLADDVTALKLVI